MHRTLSLASVLVALAACGGGAAVTTPQATPKLSLTYFTMTGWPLCAKVEPIVHELAKDYAGKVDCRVVKHDAGDSQERIKRYGLNIHGMVIVDAADKVVWSESGHKQTKDGVVAAITKLLGS